MENVHKYYLDVLKKDYANFEGRVGRKPFWMFALFNFIVAVLIGLVENSLLGANSSVLSSLYSLAVLLPSIGLGIRRLHDIGKSGWYLLVSFVPVVGWIVLLWFFITPTKK